MIFQVGDQVRINKKGIDTGWDYMVEKFKIPDGHIFTIQEPYNEKIAPDRGGMYIIDAYDKIMKYPTWSIYGDSLELAYRVTDLDQDDEDCI